MRLLGVDMQEAMDKFLNDPSQQNEVNLIAALKKASFFAPVLLNQALAKPDGGVVYEEEGSNIKFILLEDESEKLSYFTTFWCIACKSRSYGSAYRWSYLGSRL